MANRPSSIRTFFAFWLALALVVNPLLVQANNNAFEIPIELKQRYPDAEFKVIALKEYQRLRHNLIVNSKLDSTQPGFLLLAQQQALKVNVTGEETSPETTPAEITPNPATEEKCEDDCDEQPEPSAMQKAAGATMNSLSGFIPSSKEGLVVLLVIVGVILVAALVFYAGVYLYELASGKFELPSWWEAKINLDFVSGDQLDGTLSGLRFKTGLSDDKSFLGLALEAGYFDFDLKYSPTSESAYGAYWLVGPSIEFTSRNEPVSLGFEFLGGRSLHDNIGAMSLMKLGFNIRTPQSALINIHLGGLYTDLKNTSGLIDRFDEYNWIYGVELGFEF